jgi:hypothetical protein
MSRSALAALTALSTLATPAHGGVHEPQMSMPDKAITYPQRSPLSDGKEPEDAWRKVPLYAPPPLREAPRETYPCYGTIGSAGIIRCVKMER